MILLTKCDTCLRKPLCVTYLKQLKNVDFSNINIIVDCNQLLLPSGTAVGIGIDKIVRDELTHCDDCDFAKKCKYAHNDEMLKEYSRVRELCYSRGYNNVRVTCKLHRSITDEKETICTPVILDKKKKKFNFFLRNKKD